MSENLTQHRKSLEEIEEEAELARTWLTFIREFPRYALEANRGILTDYHNGEPITIKSLRESIQDQDLLSRLAVIDDGLKAKKVAEMRKTTLQSIEALLDGGVPANVKGEDRTRTLAGMMARARWMDQVQLDAWLAELVARKSYRQTPNEVLKQIANQNTPQPGFPPLPVLY